MKRIQVQWANNGFTRSWKQDFVTLITNKVDKVVQCNIVARSRNHCGHGNAPTRSLCIADVHIAVNNVINTVEAQLCYVCTVALHISLPTVWNTLRSSCKVPDMFVRFEQNMHFLDRYSYKSPVTNLTKIRPVGAALMRAIRDERTEGQIWQS